ncbi:MAG: 30S ribosomal protein S6 [Saprospirales bacterium]|jgi:small subunit ribosomal protein S6|nr:MAG: 30S ribosomal protein S6 [Saprospirales bacterium]
MRQYEVTFIVDPVLSDEEIKSTLQTYQEMLTNEGCKIVHTEEMGLKQLAYPIKRRNSGVYYCIEFQLEAPSFLDKLELSLRRDERVMRFLTISLDKFGVKYNEDKRNGLIGKKRTEDEKGSDAKKSEPKKVVADEKEVVKKVVAAKQVLEAVKESDSAASQEEE